MATIDATLAAGSLPRTRTRPRDPLVGLLVVVCGALLALAVLGPYLAPFPPDRTDILAAGRGPSSAHWLGTDALGRDILSRLLVGARLSFLGPGLVVLTSATLGTALAIAAAWFGGTFDSATKRVLNVMFAVPSVLVAVLAAALFGVGFWAPVLALSLVYVPYVARVVRSVALRERHQPYVEALLLSGMSGWRISSRHLLRNVLPIVLAQATIGFGSALMDFGAISFLGLGVQPPQAEWGLMVSEGRSELLSGSFQQSLSAGVMIIVTVVSFNVLGERLTSRIGVRR